jgi:hypothetical protein
MSHIIGFAARLWYYFRLGYSTYLTFLLGYLSTLVTVYYLAIKNIPSLLELFPKFVPFAVLATVIGVPLSVGIGWAHLKRSPAFSSEQDIAVESNPYYYKLPPGYNKDVYAPLSLEMLSLLSRLLQSEKLLDENDRARIEDLQRNMRILIEGGLVGRPRTRL